jgi:hypothetical protein
MNRIKKTGESIQKKLAKVDEAVSQQDSKPVKQLASKKKMTFYIPAESESKLNEVYAKALMRNQKIDKSALITKAIELLWKEDKNYEL